MSDAYADPFRDIDWCSSPCASTRASTSARAPFYAIGPAVVETVYAQNQDSGWPGPGGTKTGGGYVSYRFTSGPAAGLLAYIAENVVPHVSPGQTVDSSTVICTLVAGDPWCETGWASGAGTQTAFAGCGNVWTPEDEASNSFSTMGDNFNQLLISIGSAQRQTMTVLRADRHPLSELSPSWPRQPAPPPENNAMSITKSPISQERRDLHGPHALRAPGPSRRKGQPFTLTSYNGAKLVARHGTGPVTAGIRRPRPGRRGANPNGLGIVVTADVDGGTFNCHLFEA